MFNYGTNQISWTVSEQTDVLNKGCNSSIDFTSAVIGDFGKWQLRMSIMMSLLRFPVAWFLLEIIFLAPPQRFWCQKPEAFEVYSDAEWREICCPKIHNPCIIYDPDVLKSDPDFDRRFMPVVNCPKFVYDKQVFNSTITSEWDLVCSRFWLVHLSQCSMMCGVLLGGVIFGAMADKHGRKNLLMICILIQAVTSLVLAVVFAYWQFLLVRFILALASGGIGIISFVVCVEVVGGKWRTTVPILYHLPFSLGNTVMAVIAYYVRDWRKFELYLACLSALFTLYWFWLPESPRWLLATGQTDEAIVVLKKIARINNTTENFDKTVSLLPMNPAKAANNPGFMAFMKSENMRKKTILLSTNWLCLGVGFCAFSQYLESIGDNIFLTVALSGIISAPGGIACVFIVTKVGRKTTVAGFQLLTALCFVFTLFTPKGVFPYDWPRLFFAGLGLAGMAGSVPSLFLFTGELYPTVGRNAGVGGVTTFARIGSMLAPAVVALDCIMDNLPLILLATMSFLQILTLLPLPETKDCPLPETLEQAEKFTTEFSHRHRRSNERRRKRELRTS